MASSKENSCSFAGSHRAPARSWLGKRRLNPPAHLAYAKDHHAARRTSPSRPSAARHASGSLAGPGDDAERASSIGKNWPASATVSATEVAAAVEIEVQASFQPFTSVRPSYDVGTGAAHHETCRAAGATDPREPQPPISVRHRTLTRRSNGFLWLEIFTVKTTVRLVV